MEDSVHVVDGKLTLFSEHDLDRLLDATLDILRDTGIQVHSDEFLDALARTDARVDKAARHVTFSPATVKRFVDERRASQPAMTARDHDGSYVASVGCVIAPFLHDFARRTRRPATGNDLIELIHWAEVDTPSSTHIGQAVTMSEVDPRVEPIEAYALLLEHSSRPNDAAYASDTRQIEFLLELSEAYHGRRIFPHGASFMTSPLTFGERAAQQTLATIALGQTHFGFGVMPISGGNAPMTIAGNIVLSAAELLGAWLTIRARVPEATFSGGACNGFMDLRRGVATFNSPEALLADLGVAELFERRLGGAVGVAAGADYIEARLPGIQAAYERTYRAMAIAAFAGNRFHLGGSGTLDGGKVFSPVQFILERDLGEGLWRLGQGITIDEDTLAVDTIRAVGVGEGKSYLGTDHTMHYFRSMWFPQFMSRTPCETDEFEFSRDQAMLAAAHDHYRDALTRYAPPELDSGVLQEIRNTVSRARKHLTD